MCIQDRVEYIVMLCNFFEKVKTSFLKSRTIFTFRIKGARKCFQYYPASGSLQFDDITIRYVGSSMVGYVHIVQSKTSEDYGFEIT